MIFIFKKKSIFNCLVASIFGLINCKVLIISSGESYFLKKITRFGIKIQSKSLLYLDMSLANIEDFGIIDGDVKKFSDKHVANLCQDIDIFNDLSLFFPNVKNLQKKLKLFVYQHFNGIFAPQQMIITWLNSSAYKNDIIVNFSELTPGSKSVWKNSNLRVIFIFNYLNYFTGIFAEKSIKLAKNFLNITFSKYTKKKKNNNIINKNSENINFHQNEVLFFPHNGVLTSGQPPRDHFYSNEPNSPFHASKIIHLEYDSRPDIELEKEKMKKYFKTNTIKYKRFFIGAISWKNIFSFIVKTFQIKKFFQYNNVGNNIIYYGIILHAYMTFERYCNAIIPYKDAKIAIVGYEILFPKALALALENYNIKTIAISERHVSTLLNSYSFIINTLFSISEHSSKIIEKSDKFLINNVFPVGQVRTDHFFDNELIKSNSNPRVLVLDTSIDNDPKTEKFYPYLNWKNDISFRNEIISIAEHNPEIEFIFRGKNCNWYYNKYYNEMKLKIDKLTNVSVDTDYTINLWKSYHLCASADLIIARPTSLAEECVSKGMNVIVMDYGINFTTAISKFIPKMLRQYYCHSFEQLNEMFEFWKKHKYILSNDIKNLIKKEIFSNLTDGKVKERIQKNLKEIYILPK